MDDSNKDTLKNANESEAHDNEACQEDALAKQKREDMLREQERVRKWVEDDEPLPVKMSCKLSQHIVAKNDE